MIKYNMITTDIKDVITQEELLAGVRYSAVYKSMRRGKSGTQHPEPIYIHYLYSDDSCYVFLDKDEIKSIEKAKSAKERKEICSAMFWTISGLTPERINKPMNDR